MSDHPENATAPRFGVLSKDGIFLIEKSPSYLSSADAAHRIFEYNPAIKIIICLRNPVDRAFSRYNDIMVDKLGRLNKTFAQIVKSGLNKPNHFLKNGLYAPQVARYFETLGRENVKVVIQERWKAEWMHRSEYSLRITFPRRTKSFWAPPFRNGKHHKSRLALLFHRRAVGLRFRGNSGEVFSHVPRNPVGRA